MAGENKPEKYILLLDFGAEVLCSCVHRKLKWVQL